MEFHIKNGVLQKYIPKKRTEEIVIPDGVTAIGKNVFIGNKLLQRVQFPAGLTRIDDSAFYGCSDLREIILPETVIAIGMKAFGQCTRLRNVQLPDALREVGVGAFSGTEWLKHTDPLLIRGDLLICYSGAEEELILPDGLRVIAPDALKRQQRPTETDMLRRVVIPEGVEEIGAQAFRDCEALEEVFLPQSLRTIGENAFINCTHLRSVNLPDGLNVIPKNLFYNCGCLQSVQIPETVTEIHANAFFHCLALKEIRLPDGLSAIGENAFAECGLLDNVQIPAQITTIGANAFQHTKWEKDYPDDFMIHGDLLLKYKGSAQKVMIPDNVHRIGDRAFEGKKVTAVQFPPQLSEIGAYAFCQCAMLDEIVIPASVRRIGMCAFSMCKSAETVTFKGELPDMEKDAFFPLETLETIVTPGGSVELSKYIENGRWGYYYRRIAGQILSGDLAKKDLQPVTAMFLLDCYESIHAERIAKLIKKLADSIYVLLDKANESEYIVYLLSHQEFLTERMVDKMLEYAISESQKNGSAEHQMLVMRAKDTFFGAKQKKFVL